jgi:hypothetical protein
MFLEGGYCLDALRDSIHASLASALELPYESEPPSSGGPGVEYVARVREERRSALEALQTLNMTNDER